MAIPPFESSTENNVSRIAYDPNTLTILGTKTIELDGEEIQIHNVANFPTIWRFIFKYKEALVSDPDNAAKSLITSGNIRDFAYASVVVDNWETIDPVVTDLAEQEPEMFAGMVKEAEHHNQIEAELAAAIADYGYTSAEVKGLRAKYRLPDDQHEELQYRYSRLLDKIIPVTWQVNPAFDIDLFTK